MMLPGTRWRPLNLLITSLVFVFVSHRVALATSDLTNWLCANPSTNRQERASHTARSRRIPTSSDMSQQQGQEPSRSEYIALSSVETEGAMSEDREKGVSARVSAADDVAGVPSSPNQPRKWMTAAAKATVADLRIRTVSALAIFVALNWLYPAPREQ
jgi:10 TM Acyl Transferase domain found in Cas1p